MAGRGELGFPKASASSLREQLANTVLRDVRSQGHTYVELREDGKRFIFFCTLCMAPCYSDSVLYDHLKGKLHKKRLEAAKVTLLKPNPWPFNDGILFFHDLPEQEKPLPVSKANKPMLLEIDSHGDNDLAIVPLGESSRPSNNEHGENEQNFSENASSEENLSASEGDGNLIIPGVLCKDVITDLEVRFMGVGLIAARCIVKDDVPNEIRSIWCEWLGKKDSGYEDTLEVQDHDFAVVTFAYKYELGRKDLLDDVKYLLTSSTQADNMGGEGTRKKRKKSDSDPEDGNGSLTNQYDSSGEESHCSNSLSSSFPVDKDDDRHLNSRFISSRILRRELRRQQRIAEERMCSICEHKMLPGKDVATLLNTKTGRLPCSSRNAKGAFHVFHVSCLLHWILLCEFEISSKQAAASPPKVKRKSRRKRTPKCNEIVKEGEMNGIRKQFYSVFCPQCQGTGISMEGDGRENPTVRISEMFRYIIKCNDARQKWMKSPEKLQNCSAGCLFPSVSGNGVQERVLPLKLLQFYRAD